MFFPVTALGLINTRANLLEATNIREQAALDSYAFTREVYLQKRRSQIDDGAGEPEGYDELFPDNPEGEAVLIIQ